MPNAATETNDEPIALIKDGTTAWSIGDGAYFAPSNATFMVNYRVADLHGLSEFGIFAWVIDPEGNKVELWQPPEGQ